MTGKFTPAVLPASNQTDPAWWFIFSGRELLVKPQGNSLRIPLLLHGPAELGLEALRQHFLGTLDGHGCYSAEVPEKAEPPEGMFFSGLRRLYGSLDEPLYRIAGGAVEVVEWDRTHQFCSSCGTKTEYKQGVRAKECPRCGHLSFPRISPAVIVAVERDGKLLLARGNRFTTEMYSVLAGFVEPGETLEETVVREVKEEVGIEVTDISYFGSQSWPFPDSLMVAFTARYAGGKIVVDREEIVEAGWFTADDLPRIPDKISIARRLIDWFVEKQRRNSNQ
jgi:NAD+ diphosphatase